jgi:LacI family transcriptional regulator
MLNNRVDGLLVSLAYDTTGIEHFEPFIKRKIPVLFFDRIFEHEHYPQIYIDNFKAAYEVTDHLLQQGCKRIVHITGNQLRNVYAERLRGYKKALEAHEIDFDDQLVIINDLSAKEAAAATEAILQMDPLPDGIFTVNDVSAVSCIQVLKKAGIKIPEQIAVAGFNNDPAACVIEPNLTTVNYKGYEMGEAAASMLINHLSNRQDLQQTHSLILRSELIVRESSKRK